MFAPPHTHTHKLQEQLSGVVVIREMDGRAVGYTEFLRGRYLKSLTQEITRGERMNYGVQPKLCPDANMETVQIPEYNSGTRENL